MSKKVAIIIINWNSFPVTENCIDSVCRMNYTDYDIILVDNASEDGSGLQLKEKFSQIILINSHSNLGFSGGNNLGMQYAIEKSYPYIILLNNDTIVKENFLEILVQYMDTHPKAGAIQPLIYFEHDHSLVWNGGSSYLSWIGHPFVANYYKHLQPANNNIRQVDWITGCAFLTRTTILRQTGLLAEKLFIYYEDVDLSFRIKQAGFQLIYQPESVIYHIAGMSGRSKEKGREGFQNASVHYFNVRNRIWILKKYTPFYKMPSVIFFYCCYLIALLAYFLLRLRLVKFRTVIRAIRDGLGGKLGYAS